MADRTQARGRRAAPQAAARQLPAVTGIVGGISQSRCLIMRQPG